MQLNIILSHHQSLGTLYSDSEQRTPLDCAADGGHVEVMSLLLDAALNVGVKASVST